MLSWAVKECPEAKAYWNCQAMATQALTGVPAVDQATATSFGGLYEGGHWDKEALHEMGVDEAQLPVVGGMGQGLGTVTDTSTVFAGGSIDAFCEQIVAGANQPGDVLVIFGATLIVWVVAEEWKDVPGLTTLPNMMAGQVMIGGPSNAGALFADWARNLTEGPARRKASCPISPTLPRPPGRGIRPRCRCGFLISGVSGRPSTTPRSAPACTVWTSPRAPRPSCGRPTRPAGS